MSNEKYALIIEGGGMKGVFASGVLDSFIHGKFNPFTSYIGISAGACNLAPFLTQDIGLNYMIYEKYTPSSMKIGELSHRISSFIFVKIFKHSSATV